MITDVGRSREALSHKDDRRLVFVVTSVGRCVLIKTMSQLCRSIMLISLFFPFVLFCFVFQDRVSLCNSVCPGTCFVGQAGPKLTEIHLPLPPKYWDYRPTPPHLNDQTIL